MFSFEEWLLNRDIDVESLTPELRAALIAQWANEQQQLEPPESIIVVADDECWPHAERLPVF